MIINHKDILINNISKKEFRKSISENFLIKNLNGKLKIYKKKQNMLPIIKNIKFTNEVKNNI